MKSVLIRRAFISEFPGSWWVVDRFTSTVIPAIKRLSGSVAALRYLTGTSGGDIPPPFHPDPGISDAAERTGDQGGGAVVSRTLRVEAGTRILPRLRPSTRSSSIEAASAP